jgi:hypothetical protein
MFTRLVAGATLLAASFAGTAGPRVLEETARIPAPDPSYQFPVSLAVDGDWLIATGMKEVNPHGTSEQDDHSAWLFQRQPDGTWTLVRRLVQHLYYSGFDIPPMTVDMHGGVAAILHESFSWIFERSGADWISAPSPIITDGMDIAVNGGTILATEGYCAWSANAYRKNSSGAWVHVRSTESQPDEFCENEDDRGSLDVSGNANIVFTWANELYPEPSARIFEGPYGTTNPPQTVRVLGPDGFDLWSPVALDLPTALVVGEPNGGIYVFTRDSFGLWAATGRLVRPDLLALGWPGATTIDMRGGLAVMGSPLDSNYGERSGSAAVFQRDANNNFRQVARLLASDRRPIHVFGRSDISGRRVATRADGAVYIFDLPATLTSTPTVQDGFEDGNASDWTPLAGSSFSVVTTNSRVYRQSSTVGNAASIWGNTDRTNQAVEAHIKPTAYATTTGDKWFGLVTRYLDANNYYYVTLRNNNTVLLRRMLNGVFTTLDSAALPITLNRTYRVRLEAIGTRLRVFVDDQLLGEASDTAITHGQAGVMMYKTRADYDNVLVSVNPRSTLVSYVFHSDTDSQENWDTLGTWEKTAEGVFAQSDLASGARAITGVATDDQVVHARMRRTSAAGTNNWFGLATRYRDAGNYYYFTLRNNNTIALRKLVNNAIVELDTAPFTVAGNTWYRARFEAIGTQLRVYINDALLLEATDSSHITGRYGPVMYRAAVEYDDILAVQP